MKILVIRFSSIGDIVLTTPVIRCIKRQLDGVELHYLTKKDFAPLLEANPYVDRVHSFENVLREIMPLLLDEHYDHVVDLHRNIRSLKVKAQLDCSAETFNKLNFEKFLIVNFKVNRLPGTHVATRYFEAVEELEVKDDGEAPDYFIPEKEEFDLSRLPPGFRSGFIAWVVGGNHFTKMYPSDKIVEVCQSIDSPVLLLGNTEDKDRGDLISSESGSNVLNLCGQLSLHQSASVVREAQKVITNDTGLMHIAAAFQKEVISLWGNTIPEFGMYPYFGKNKKKEKNLSQIHQVSELYCRPCSKIGFNHCPEGHFRCMREITVDQVLRAIYGKAGVPEKS